MVTKKAQSIDETSRSTQLNRSDHLIQDNSSVMMQNLAATARLLEEMLTTIEKIDENKNGKQTRIFFPNGISRISINLGTGAEKVEFKIEGESLTNLNSVPRIGALAVAESCRDQLRFSAGDDLSLGEKVPAQSETSVSGPITKKIKRTDPEFNTLVENSNAAIVFKDEEGSGADRMMSQRLKEGLDAIADAVANEWDGVKLRITEAWDENNEHAGDSLHYEGRAADLTTYPIDTKKLGRLGRLAVEAGCDWVWYENEAHVHVSVKKS